MLFLVTWSRLRIVSMNYYKHMMILSDGFQSLLHIEIIKRPGMVAYTCKPSIHEAETG